MQEVAQLRAEVEAVAAAATAEGPSCELTDEDWTEIMSTRPEDVDPMSLAVPPGWRAKKT